MNYSQTSIANLALNRIGARTIITDVNENSPNAKKVLAVWDSVFQEVLSERDWRFAKSRVVLQLLPVTPLYAYKAAWALPGDLLRFVRPHKRPQDTTLWAWFWGWGPSGEGWYQRDDPPFHPCGWPYVIESIANGVDQNNNPIWTQAALTDYCGECGPVKINYIRLISDYTSLMPGFVNCLAYRLAAEIAISITEDIKKLEAMQALYQKTLNSAEAQNECLDFSKDESGSSSWVRAGRYIGWDGNG